MNRWKSEDGEAIGTPSDLTLDAHVLAGGADADLNEDEQKRVAELRRQAADFRNSVAARELHDHLLRKLDQPVRARRQRRTRTIWWQPVGALATAAAIVALVVVAAPSEHNDSVIGVKGNLAVETWVQRDGRTVPLRGGHMLTAGDRVGFRVTSGQNAHVALFGTDGDGAVALVPVDGREAVAVSAGVRTDLPGSALLDGTGHMEQFAVVACPEPFEAHNVARTLSAWAAGAGSAAEAGAAVEAAVASTCDTVFLSYPKR